MKRKMWTILLAVFTMILLSNNVFAAEVLGTGKCGPKVTWTLTSDGVLTISGEGYMWDYNKGQRPGWEPIRDEDDEEEDYEDEEEEGNGNSPLITKIIVNEGVTTVGSNAFEADCSGMDDVIEVVLPSSLERIGRDAFGYQERLQSVTIADHSTLKEVGNRAFNYCISLKELKLPEGVISIGRNCFDGCGSLVQLNIPASVVKIGEDAFLDYDGENECIPWVANQIKDKQVLVINGTLVAVNKEKCVGTVVVPEGTKVIGGYADYSEWEGGGNGTFNGCDKMTKAVLPSSLTLLGDGAFSYCENLEEVVFAENLDFIGFGAFEGCGKLKKVEIPDSVSFIGGYAFFHCVSLESVELPSSLESIEYSTFGGCSLLDGIEIPEGVRRIEEQAFEGASSLKDVVIPQSVEYIGGQAFYGTEWIANLSKDGMAIIHEFLLDVDSDVKTKSIPEGIREICGVAFSASYPTGEGWIRYSENDQLTKIDFPSTLEIIDDSAFQGCVNLTEVAIPEGVKEIGDYAFDSCENLSHVNIPKSVEKVGYGVFKDTAFSESFKEKPFVEDGGVEDDWDLESIPVKPFIVDGVLLDGEYWDDAGDVTLPSGIRLIADRAFTYTEGITSIRVSEGVEHIGSCAFAVDSNLKKVYIPKSVKSIAKDAFRTGLDGGALQEIRYAGTEAEWRRIGGDDLNLGGNVNVKIIFEEDNYKEIETFVSRLYQNFLGRDADSSGLASWASLLTRGDTTGSKVVYGFVYSPEFQNNPLSNEEFVTAMYETIFGRKPDAVGLKAWVNVLENGCTRKKVLAGFLNSMEMEDLCDSLGVEPGSYHSNEVVDRNTKVTFFVSRMYQYCLGRKADFSGLSSWVSALLDGSATGTTIAKGFFFSKEMDQMNLSDHDYIVNVYVALLDRQPDTDGLRSWEKALASNSDRRKIVNGFVKSQEFGNLCAEYGITR